MTQLRPTARRINLTIQAGDDRPPTIPITDGAGGLRDVTGCTARAVVRSRLHASKILHVWAGASAPCDARGVRLLVDDSESWDWQVGNWDLLLTDLYGAQRVEAFGLVTVRKLVSRP